MFAIKTIYLPQSGKCPQTVRSSPALGSAKPNRWCECHSPILHKPCVDVKYSINKHDKLGSMVCFLENA